MLFIYQTTVLQGFFAPFVNSKVLEILRLRAIPFQFKLWGFIMPSGTEIPWWEATAARFSYRNGAPFPKPPVSVTETGPRSSYRNGAPFPKPPVSVTSVDLFPCLQSQLKNERGDPNLLVFPYLSSVSLVILKKWRRESFTYNKYLFILSKKHKKNKWKCRSL